MKTTQQYLKDLSQSLSIHIRAKAPFKVDISSISDLSFNNFVAIANECKKINQNSISITLLDPKSLPAALNNLTYVQKYKITALYLEANYVKSHTYFEEDITLADLPFKFDVNSNPDAYYNLLNEFMGFTPYKNHILSLIFECHKNKLLTNSQTCELLSAYSMIFLQKTFSFNGKLNIPDLSNFLAIHNDKLDSKSSSVMKKIFLVIWQKYNFNNLEERLAFYDAAYKENNVISTIDLDMDYELILNITKKTQDYWMTERYLKENSKSLSKEQKLELINLIMNYDSSMSFIRDISDINLSEEDLLPIYQKAKTLKWLLYALNFIGWDKDKIMTHLEEYIKNLSPKKETFLGIELLKLNLQEVEDFAHRNPLWSHILDEWIGHTPQPQTNDTLSRLLEFRLKNSDYPVSLRTLKYYNYFSNEDMENAVIRLKPGVTFSYDIHPFISWDLLYDRKLKLELQQDLRHMETVLDEMFEHPNPNKHLKQLIEDSPFMDNKIIQLIHESPSTAHESFDKIYQKMCNSLADILDQENLKTALIKTTKNLYSNNIKEENLPKYTDNFMWLSVFCVRLIHECEFNSIKRAFNNQTFIKTLEQVSIISSPDLRARLLDYILKLMNSNDHLNTFCTAISKAGGYKYIPALIILGNVTEPTRFQPLIKYIGHEFRNSTNKMSILINTLVDIFSQNISDESKFKIMQKLFVFELHIVNQKPEISEVNFNSLYIIDNEDQTYGLLGYNIKGQLIDIKDISNYALYSDLNNLLKRKNSPLEERLATISKTGQFANSTSGQMQALHLIQGIAALNELEKFSQDLDFSKQSWHNSYGLVIQKCFELPEEKLQFAIDTMQDCRKPYSLISYFAKIKSLKEEIYSQMLRDFVWSISSPESKDFYQERYNLEQQEQLAAALKMTNEPNFLKIWQTEITENYDSFYNDNKNNFYNERKQQEFDAPKFLIERIKEFKHLDPVDFRQIHEYLNAETSTDKQRVLTSNLAYNHKLNTKLQELINEDKKLKANTPSKEINSQRSLIQYNINQIKELICKIELQTSLMKYFENEHSYDDTANLKTLLKIKYKAMETHERTIFDDLTLVIERLHNKNKKIQQTTSNRKNLIIINTDHFWHMLLSGSDILGSCQNVNGNPKLNKHLLATILSGHIRQIAIVNTETNEIIARGLLKLMINQQDNVPVLFLERIYPDYGNPEHTQMIVQMAKLTAEKLGCSLISKLAPAETKLYAAKVTIKEVKVSEYSDALRGPQTAGYSIADTNCLYEHIITPKPALTFAYDKQRNHLPLVQEFKVYDLTASDIPLLIDLDAQCYRLDLLWSKNMWQRVLSNPNTIFKKVIYASNSHEVIASLIVSHKNQDEFVIQSLTVKEQYRRQSLATKLFENLAEFLHFKGFAVEQYTLKLNTETNNSAAIALYNKLGFKEFDDTNKPNKVSMQQPALDFVALMNPNYNLKYISPKL